MLGSLALAAFLASSSAVSRAPFLLDMARDLDTDLTAVANLMSITSLSWGIVSLVAGTASDRLGRKTILATAFLTLAGSIIGLALAPTFLIAGAWSLSMGVGGGAFMGTVFATVADHVPAARRGRAMGWIMTGQSLSLVLGAPLATLIGAQLGWRGAHVVQGSVALLVGISLWLVVPRRGSFQASKHGSAAGAPFRTILSPRILSLLVSGTTERICFGAMAVYLATFLLTTYGVALQDLALALLLVTLGNLLGNVVGSQIADRTPSREAVFAASLFLTACVAVPLLMWTPGLELSIGLGFVYTLANAIGRPSLMAALSAVPESMRGTVLGLNVTFASMGWITAAAAGGWLIATSGFGALGILCASVSLLGAICVTAGALLHARRNLPRLRDESAPLIAGSSQVMGDRCWVVDPLRLRDGDCVHAADWRPRVVQR